MKGITAPTEQLQTSDRMLSLVTIGEQKPWVPVRILNPKSTTKTIPKNIAISTVHRLGIAENILEFDTSDSQLVGNVTTQQKVRFPPPRTISICFTFLSLHYRTAKARTSCLLWEYSDIFLNEGDKAG